MKHVPRVRVPVPPKVGDDRKVGLVTTDSGDRVIAERRVRLTLWWDADKEASLRKIADGSGVSLDELVDEILDDWAEGVVQTIAISPVGTRLNIGRFTFVKPADR